MDNAEPKPKRLFLDMNGYQWTVLFAAWLGWGFDIFDGLLFNFVAKNCVPTLLGIPIGSPRAAAVTLQWTGYLMSLLLIGWAVGGIIFGRIADRVGRTRALMLTMLLYSLGTAACAFAPNMTWLVIFRIVASLGIGGEWAAGASMVAEVVPEKRRVEAGALLYTSAPMGLFLATYVNYYISGVAFKGDPGTSWRYVFLCGLIPAVIAFAVRYFVKEPDRWKNATAGLQPPKIAELFSPKLIRVTLGGLAMALVALVTWWSCNTFIAIVSKELAIAAGQKAQAEVWVKLATNCFNIGGLIGTLLTVPAAKHLGRRPMFAIYFVLSSIAMFCAFGLPMDGHTRLYMYFPIGLTVFGVFGSFTYYLPELFPTRLRGTGAGFCYNAGRIFASVGPFLVGSVASMKGETLPIALRALFYVGFVPLVGLVLLPFIKETKGQVLED